MAKIISLKVKGIVSCDLQPPYRLVYSMLIFFLNFDFSEIFAISTKSSAVKMQQKDFSFSYNSLKKGIPRIVMTKHHCIG
jgi:hypothetical protein